VVQVALLAERMDHHPDIEIRYRQVTLRLSTHSAGGLTERDFHLAQQIDTALEK
jgi:4a-hydroxytetrahydrobiopterin dehydratase